MHPTITRNPGVAPSIPDYQDWQKQLKSFDTIGGYWTREYAISGTRDSKRAFALGVFSSYFSLLQLPPTLGRTLNIDDERYGHHLVVVISDGFWKTMFGADPDGVGHTITMDSEPYHSHWRHAAGGDGAESAGADVDAGRDTARHPPAAHRSVHARIGRIKPGVSRQTAAVELETMMAGLAATYEDDKGVCTYLVPVPNDLTTGETRRELIVLLAAVGMLLLIACVNIANLVSVRSWNASANSACGSRWASRVRG